MKVVSVCKKCKCTEWNYDVGGKLVCKCCGSLYSPINKWFLPAEDKELTLKDGKEFFTGNLKDHGLEEGENIYGNRS